MKERTKGFITLVVVVAFAILVAWIESDAATPYLDTLLLFTLTLLFFAAVAVFFLVRKERATRRYQVRHVRHLGETGWSLYTVTFDGNAKVVSYEEEDFPYIGRSEQQVANMRTKSISMKEAISIVKDAEWNR